MQKEYYDFDCSSRVYPLVATSGKTPQYRIAAKMTDELIPEALQQALDAVLKRFPLFSTVVARGFFWQHLRPMNRRILVREATDSLCAPFDVHHEGDLLRVLYRGQHLVLEAFHGLSDGYGGMIFFKNLLAEYLRLTGSPCGKGGDLKDLSETAPPEEFTDGFTLVDAALPPSGYKGSRPALHTDGKQAAIQPAGLVRFEMQTTALKEAAQRQGVSITVLILAAIMHAAARSRAKDNPRRIITLELTLDMRQHFPTVSMKNFTLFAIIEASHKAASDMATLIPLIEAQVKEKTAKESVERLASKIKKLANNPFLKYVPLGVKRLLLRTIYYRIAQNAFTVVFSNIGLVREDFAGKVDSFAVVPGPSYAKTFNCGLISHNGKSVLMLGKSVANDMLETQLCEVLASLGLYNEHYGKHLR